MKLPELILAVFVPGLAVGLRCGMLSRKAGLAWLLTLAGHLPGVVYAVSVISPS
jgi:uncharacterized membrane protein YqaE (UPF0057 family)